MAKVIDITDKLDFEGNPKLKIKDEEIEINADAATMLKLMGVMGDNDEPGSKEVLEMYNLLFASSERKKIEKLKLNFKDFTAIIFIAIGLVKGEDDTQGE
ncbi:hypothetical protein A8806_110165 [Faecalicatena orotica]|uniref:Uncharacterized protein n=1 Tax=Faecalicatena orotica TaxID=1544 RepID=A0A2Y9BHR3_9FIRM|nr:hypothetical protein [Faecalicatena orotica]PWJ27990.1 hypothetical protein A8806_110165 [Faecalicatena orotica]SSA57013.1 hypothetical protein SAMN05216536_110165 [Faecalicatena orotica]